ncbi:hypothetical protein CRYUN_Cryun25bG0087900 [Craigia yunnanensis]
MEERDKEEKGNGGEEEKKMDRAEIGWSRGVCLSTSVDDKIKAWLYDIMGSRVDYYTPGRSCETMAYSADGKRIFQV